ncbi:MAG TPA: DUF433 domain-containing protein [Planctomycetota bacterium]|nr:DUF433 domain-containing protein [Planctomycetota bacterium]
MDFPRITFEQDKLGGKACVRGLRTTVASVLRMVASGMTVEEILAEHPDLEAEDIAECLRYAAYLADERVLPMRSTGS